MSLIESVDTSCATFQLQSEQAQAYDHYCLDGTGHHQHENRSLSVLQLRLIQACALVSVFIYMRWQVQMHQ